MTVGMVGFYVIFEKLNRCSKVSKVTFQQVPNNSRKNYFGKWSEHSALNDLTCNQAFFLNSKNKKRRPDHRLWVIGLLKTVSIRFSQYLSQKESSLGLNVKGTVIHTLDVDEPNLLLLRVRN